MSGRVPSEESAVASREGCTRYPVIVLLSTTGLSQFGNVLTAVAVPWFVLQLTGSATRTGMVGAVIILPTIIAGILGGVLADRIGHKRMSVVSDVASGLAVATIPLIHLIVGIEFWQLLTLMFLSALLDVPGAAARQSMLPELAEKASYRLERANSVFSTVSRGAQLVGPLVAGLLIASVGPSQVLWFNAATFGVSALLVAVAIPLTSSPRSGTPASSYRSDMIDGLRFVWHDGVLRALISSAAALNFIANPLAAVVLPVYANEVFGGATQLGIMLAGFGGGAVVGTLLYGMVGYRYLRRSVYTASLLAASLPFGILAFTPDVIFTVAALTMLGVAIGPGAPIFMTVLQERTPVEMRGRVFGLVSASVWIVLPLGMLLSGVLLERFGLTVTLLLQASAFFMLALSVALLPALREIETPSP